MSPQPVVRIAPPTTAAKATNWRTLRRMPPCPPNFPPTNSTQSVAHHDSRPTGKRTIGLATKTLDLCVVEVTPEPDPIAKFLDTTKWRKTGQIAVLVARQRAVTRNLDKPAVIIAESPLARSLSHSPIVAMFAAFASAAPF